MMIRRAVTGTLLAAIAVGGAGLVTATQASAEPHIECSRAVNDGRTHLAAIGSPESSTDSHTVYNHIASVVGGAAGSAKAQLQQDMNNINTVCF